MKKKKKDLILSRLTSLGDGRNARVFVVKASDKRDGIASEVGLVVEGVLGVDEALIGDEGVLNESGTVFEDEANLEGGS